MQVLLLSAYRREGYLHVFVTPIEKIDTTEKRIYVEINVEPGTKVMMGNIVSSDDKRRRRNLKESERGNFVLLWNNPFSAFPRNSSAALQNDEKRYNQTIPKIGKASKKEKTLFHKSYFIFCTFAI